MGAQYVLRAVTPPVRTGGCQVGGSIPGQLLGPLRSAERYLRPGSRRAAGTPCAWSAPCCMQQSAINSKHARCDAFGSLYRTSTLQRRVAERGDARWAGGDKVRGQELAAREKVPVQVVVQSTCYRLSYKSSNCAAACLATRPGWSDRPCPRQCSTSRSL